jgi:hypothetical protein
MQLPHTTLRLALASTLLLLSTSCASILTTWHDQSYTSVVDTSSELVETVDGSAPLEQVADLASSADELYRQGYVLVGYSKFSHTIVPGFQAMYAKMYADRIGAARVVQAEPVEDGGVYAYTVTYWAPGKRFPFGAYYNDVPEETALLFPDSLREALGADGRAVFVEEVVAGTPADEAGIRGGELIVAVDGVPFDGTDGLDALIPERAEEDVTITVWGMQGLRTTTCRLRERFVCADGHGVEGLYYNQPWAFDDYANFQQYSQAFTEAWNDGIAAYEEQQRIAQEQATHDARYASMGSEISYLNGRIDDLERRPSSREDRMGSHIDELRRDGAKNWEEFSKSLEGADWR